jgi:hypothetical protein
MKQSAGERILTVRIVRETSSAFLVERGVHSLSWPGAILMKSKLVDRTAVIAENFACLIWFV